MRRARIGLLALIIMTAPLWLGACGEDRPTSESPPLTDEEAILALYGNLKASAEAHDLVGFLTCIHPDYLHCGINRTLLAAGLADPDEGLSTIQTVDFLASAVNVQGDRASVTARFTFTMVGGETMTIAEPDLGGRGFGAGWLARAGSQWLIIGNRKHCGTTLAVGHSDQTAPDDYFLSMAVRSDTRQILGAVIAGPGLAETALEPNTHEVNGWIRMVRPPHSPTVGDVYTFRVNYTGGRVDTVNIAVRPWITFLPPFTVATPSLGTAQLAWPDSSGQVPEADHYRVSAKAPEEPDSRDSLELPLNQTSYTMSGLTSGRTYEFRLILFDIYGNQAYTREWATVP